MPVALRQTASSPRVLRTHLHAYVRRIYAASFRVSIGLQRYSPSHPDASPQSASCTSDPRFACGFLQIPGHPRHPCRPANISPYRACRGLAPPSECALPGAQNKKPGASAGLPVASRFAYVALRRRRLISIVDDWLALFALGRRASRRNDLPLTALSRPHVQAVVGVLTLSTVRHDCRVSIEKRHLDSQSARIGCRPVRA